MTTENNNTDLNDVSEKLHSFKFGFEAVVSLIATSEGAVNTDNLYHLLDILDTHLDGIIQMFDHARH